MIRLFKKKSFLLLLFTVIILIVIGITSRPNSRFNYLGSAFNFVISPFQQFASYTGDKVGGVTNYFGDVETLKEENDELKKRVIQLEDEVRELEAFRKKNEELREALNIKDQFSDFEFYGANVIAKDIGNWFNVFTINVGINDGIKENDTVITQNALVGRVMTTDIMSSKVISIIDVDSTVSARIVRTRDLVVVKGDLSLKDDGLCRIEYIEPHVDISVGDTIETSGLGGIYPRGIVIGEVKEVRQVNNQLNRYAIIEPTVDLKRIEEVYVLNRKY
ncbi:rod shape-determining protein MreC [Herbivorax sp. ANBcel31]|uniref:rod shape-determining protein MreC n=1 Tax=Herbivorax sp. ANBcel31 TaxID=3069754 RepID=UPI0027B18644|nr:rod shape-determining protein MreC [Herbivorax sp. ANBcel31]MDQ2086276.1 rod shape-determining protein MreC [Herbivorax sp. ANBcel31]